VDVIVPEELVPVELDVGRGLFKKFVIFFDCGRYNNEENWLFIARALSFFSPYRSHCLGPGNQRHVSGILPECFRPA